jgi:hypothetical protein
MSKSSLIPLLTAGAVLALALVLNPSADRHRLKIKEAVSERSPVAGALGFGSLAGMVSTYHSLGVASYTTVGDRTMSIGAFGVVYVP